MRPPTAVLACFVALACLASAACQPRVPLTRAEAAAAAQNWCVREGKTWGDPVDVTAPTDASDGHRFWTVRYLGPESEVRIVLVNADTGWTKPGP